MIYKGVEGTLWFIPTGWRHINDDGTSEWVGHGLALMVAFFGSIAILSKLSELAAARAREIWDRPRSQDD